MSPELAAAKKKQSTIVRVAVVVAGLVALGAIGYFSLVKPKESKASSLKTEIAQLDRQIADTKNQTAVANSLSKILVADYAKLNTAMPSKPQMTDFYFQLDKIAADTGIRFSSITPSAPVSLTGFQVVPIALTFEGTFYDVSDFLQRLQALVLVQNHELVARGRLFTVDDVSFQLSSQTAAPESGASSGTSEKASSTTLTATIDVVAYVYGQPFTTATGSSAGASATSTTSTSTTTTSTETTSTTTTSTETSSATGGS
jgi:Tfp pilus assembly protein PilO